MCIRFDAAIDYGPSTRDVRSGENDAIITQEEWNMSKTYYADGLRIT